MTGLIVHEWLEASGGSERVVDELVALYPDAELQVLWDDAPGRFARAPRETWIARTPLRRSKMLALPFLPATWRTIRMRADCEWVLVSSHLFAHHVRARRRGTRIPKLVYAHTPARYIWEPGLDRRGAAPPVRAVAGLVKSLDRARAQEAAAVATNSQFTRARIERAWRRDATVIYPPVDTAAISGGGPWAARLTPDESAILDRLPSDFLLGASRFVRYKRLDAVIEAGSAVDLPVVLAGGGPEAAALHARADDAPVPVHFVDRPSDRLLRALYERCVAFVFPAIEDFGIMPVEAMAAGAPVIAAPEGGAAESVSLTGGGVAVETFSPAAWRAGVDAASAIDRATLPGRAAMFSVERFRAEVAEWVRESVGAAVGDVT